MQEHMTKSEAKGYFDDVKELFNQTERLFKEKSQEAERRFQETERLIRAASQDTDRKFQDTDRKFQELRLQMGRLGNRLGDFVEEMVRPAAVRLFREKGFDVCQTLRDLSVQDARGNVIMQIDLLVMDTDTAIAVECKSRCSVDDVTDHLERLSGFKKCFHQYAHVRLHGAVAAMVMPDDAARHAYRKGLFVLAQSGDTIIIRNDDKFQARVW